MLLTSGFLGEILTAVGTVPILGVNFLSELDEASGSFLGEIFTGALVFSPPSLSSSFFFITASLELVLTGTGFFLGDGLMASSEMLPAAESELPFFGNVARAGFSSEPLRA